MFKGCVKVILWIQILDSIYNAVMGLTFSPGYNACTFFYVIRANA